MNRLNRNHGGLLEKAFPKTVSEKYIVVIVSTFVFGVISHGMVMFNQYYFHDDALLMCGAQDYLSTFLSFGRWGYAFLVYTESLLFGSKTVLMPVWEVSISLMMQAIIACVFVKLFKITKRLPCVCLAAILTCFPSNAGLYGYLSASHYYMVGLLFGVIGAYVACERRINILSAITAIVLIAFSISVYQVYVIYPLAIFFIYSIITLVLTPDIKKNDLLGRSLFFFFVYFVAVLAYFIITKLILILRDTSMLRIESYGLNPIIYLKRIPYAVTMFFTGSGSKALIFNGRWFYVMCIILLYIYSIIRVIGVFKVNRGNGLTLSFFFFCIPLVFNSIYIICPAEDVHAMMEYTFVLPLVLLLLLLSLTPLYYVRDTMPLIKVISSVLVVLCIFSFIRTDNMCYFKAGITKQRATTYFSTLITRIQSVDGYADEMPVLFINPGAIDDKNVRENTILPEITIQPYATIMDDYANDYAYLRYMKYWCGYNPGVVEKYDTLKYEPFVTAMPIYPQAGSIKVKGDTIFVKLGEWPRED